MIQEIKRIIKESEITKEDDSKWPQKNKDGRQELEIRMGSEHIQFEVGCTLFCVERLLTEADCEDRLPRGCHRLC